MSTEAIKAMEIKKEVIIPKTEFVDAFSKEIYEQTYKFGTDKDIDGTFERVAKNLASIEKDKEYWEKKFMYALSDFKFIPGGRITSNAGTNLKGTTYINCFVDGFLNEDQDSMEGILDALRRQALILKSEGGYGFCADVMRPRGAFVNGIGNETPGAVRMLDMWDTQSAVITEGSGRLSTHEKAKKKIRKGAQLVSLSCSHPDIEEFITSKSTHGRLTKFNMSVLITDDFMNAVENNLSWNLEFPDYDMHPKEYKKYWNGNLKEWKSKGLAVRVYKTYNNANELWDLVMKSTYNKNEPGVLFIDTANKLNNLYYCEYINATNPCGEQLLPIGGVCLLGSLNLTQFIDIDKKDWDYKKLEEIIPVAVRFMDNVNDLTLVPLPSQKQNLMDKRRIGLGMLGYGSALMMLKIRYGSKEALSLTDKLMGFIANTAYKSSALLAKEKGSFGLYDEEKYLQSKFIKQALSEETISLIKKHGIRNSHLLSIQPTGNSSIFANNVSGGLEPLFMPEYVRTNIIAYTPEGLEKPRNVDFSAKKFECETTKWVWTKEGDENILKTVEPFEGRIYKFDKSRGLLKEDHVKDYAVRYLEKTGEWDPKATWAATTTELSVDEHVKTMAVIAKYIDSAMSKTINLPNTYSYDDFKTVYTNLYKTGLVKGGTTYRAGTMTTVLAEKKDENKIDIFSENHAKKRPREVEADLVRFNNGGEKWISFIGKVDGYPYEIFTGPAQDVLNLPQYVEAGKIIKFKEKDKKSRYDFRYIDKDGFNVTIEGLSRAFSKEFWNYTKLISGLLRHKMHLPSVVELVSNLELPGGANINTWQNGIVRSIKKYIRDGQSSDKKCSECGEEALIYQEGCLKCTNCGSGKC